MLHAKLFRSTVRARPHQVDRHQRGEEGAGRAARRHRRRRDEGAAKAPITARRSTTSRSWRTRRCASSASRSPPCIATDPHIAEEAVQLITAEYEELPAVYDEVEALTSKVYVHDVLKPAGTFADLKHLKDAKNTNLALDYRLRRGDFDKAFAAAAHMFEHEFRTQKVLHLPFEPFASHLPTTRTPTSPSTPPRRARRSCAPRSRACSAGRRTRCASRCRISARATAPSSTSSSKRWRWRCR